MTKKKSFLFNFISNLIDKIGYIGIALLMAVENIIPPIPSELVMPFAGYLSAQGRMQLWLVILAGTVGTLIGTWFWFVIGRKLGVKKLQAFSRKHGRWLGMTPDEIENARGWFDRHGKAAVFFGRMLPGVRTYISIPAGMSHMSNLTFFIYTFFGTVLWTALLVFAGYLLERNFNLIGEWIDPITYCVLFAFISTYLWKVITYNPDKPKRPR